MARLNRSFPSARRESRRYRGVELGHDFAAGQGPHSPPGKVPTFHSEQRGGVFEAVADRGGQCFVAGPTLWTDLYGQWISDSAPDTTFGLADESLLQAATKSLTTAVHQYTVVHFGRVDAAAHQHGTRSPEYRASARWCDEAIAQVYRVMGPSCCLIVTSDHGNTER